MSNIQSEFALNQIPFCSQNIYSSLKRNTCIGDEKYMLQHHILVWIKVMISDFINGKELLENHWKTVKHLTMFSELISAALLY